MLAKRVPRRAVAYAVMLATFTAVGVLQWPLVPVVAVIAPLSIFAAWPRRPTGPTDA
jgi:chromate transporter